MRWRLVLISLTMVLVRSVFGSVGFRSGTVPDADGKPIAIGIWYPANEEASPQKLGSFSQSVALDSEVSGAHLPLIVMSHGVYGSMASHYDTAIELAEAGFVVVAPTHTGDSNVDQAYIGNVKDLIDRPRQVKVVLDWLLSSWRDRRLLDPNRIGIFGFSLGGFTALVEMGGVPELVRTRRLCSIHAEAPECVFIKTVHGNQLSPAAVIPKWTHDRRIKAAVIAAPAVSYLFGPGALASVQSPIQLWRAEDDSNAPDAWNSGIVRAELPRPPDEHVVSRADHYVFLAPCSSALARVAPAICQDEPGFDRTEFHRSFNSAVVEFFRTELTKPMHRNRNAQRIRR